MGEALTEFDDTRRSEYARLRTVIQKIESSGGSHPDLAAHDAMGLATDAELAAHVAAADPHGVTQPSAHTDLNVVQPYIVVYMWKRTA